MYMLHVDENNLHVAEKKPIYKLTCFFVMELHNVLFNKCKFEAILLFSLHFILNFLRNSEWKL